MQATRSYRRLRENFVNLGFSKFKMKLLFVLFIGMYLIMYIYSTNSTFSYTCVPCSSTKTTRTTKEPRDKVLILIESQSENVNQSDLMGLRTFSYNLRNMGPAASNEELEFLLNIRKLILFSVHELNKPLKNTGCIKWWANPLDFISYEEIAQFENTTSLKIRFVIQPGNTIQLQAEIRQQKAPIGVDDKELEIVNLELLGTSAISGPCKNETLSETTKKHCICIPPTGVAELEKVTQETRKNWNLMDPDLITWHPTASFMIEDYMNFTDYEWFITSPGNTKEEVIKSKDKYSSEYCGPTLKMLIMISSAPMHFKQRQIIRETFASSTNLEGKGIKVVFLMGIPANKSVNDEVIKETAISKDIIQANFEDSYHNLTISHLSMYKWIQLTCENGKNQGITLPKFVLKADDDYLINVDLALKVAEENTDAEFIGCIYCGLEVIRNTSYMHKYYTPRYMHISGSYAGYLSGVIYLLQTHVIPRLLHMSLTTPMIHMDDAYVSGILLRKLKIYPGSSELFAFWRFAPDPCKTKTMASSNVLNPDDMMAQWKKFIEPAPSNCSLNNLPIKVQILDQGTKRACFFE